VNVQLTSTCLLSALLLAGCDRHEVQVYRVPKEPVNVEQAEGEVPHRHDHESPAPPRLRWTLPEGWQEQSAGGMRVGSFVMTNQQGARAEVAIIPLPDTGQELDLVNMWRAQVQLAPITAENIDKEAESVRVGGEAGKLFQMASADTNSPIGLLVAMVPKTGQRWFFKMTGHSALVREQKPAFIAFLDSIKFESASAEPLQLAKASRPVSTNTKQVPRENSDRPVWVVPPGWKEVPGGEMLVAKFIIGGNGAKAELNVSQLSGAGGGLLPNVNRWRNQLGLGPLTEADLSQQLQSLDLPNGKAMLVDMTGNDPRTGQKARLLGAIVPQTDQSWFYKLMGNEQIVEREREVFTRFLQTVKYSNVP
jgi:hypothetical protein